MFAQELDPYHRILEFRVFNPFAYYIVKYIHEPIEKMVGDVGLMGFSDTAGVVTVDDAHKVTRLLRQHTTIFGSSPFFDIDAYYLTAQFAKIAPTARKAGLLFHDVEIGARWAKAEEAFARTQMMPLRQAEYVENGELERLRTNFDDPAWPAKWKVAWTGSGFADAFTNLAVDFVEHTRSSKNAADVLHRLVSDRNFRQQMPTAHLRLLEFASGWLASPRSQAPFDKKWGGIFLSVFRQGSAIDEKSGKTAIRYLSENLEAAKGPWIYWSDVWKALWRAHLLEDDLFSVATHAVRQFSGNSKFVGVLLSIKQTRGGQGSYDDKWQARSLAILREWVITSIAPTGRWITAFLRLLEEFPDDEELRNFGKTWLKAEKGVMKRWPSVYHAIAAIEGETLVLKEMAREWVLKANRDMQTWPSMVLHVLYMIPDDSKVAAVAREWLQSQPSNPKAWDLNILLNSEDASGKH